MKVSIPSSARACTMTHPKNRPMTTPREVPWRAMITDSHRMVEDRQEAARSHYGRAARVAGELGLVARGRRLPAR